VDRSSYLFSVDLLWDRSPLRRPSRDQVAALIDLAGMKVAVVTQRAELKDYLDIHALLTKAGIPLPKMLAAGGVIYGAEFNPLLSLKAIAYHNDPTLADLPDNVRHVLSEAVKATTPQQLPVLSAVRMRGANS
jgi:aminoglycoside/choline kinase family phosphotransferase